MAENVLELAIKRVMGWFLPIINLERVAFILHRITGFYLAIYLPLHIISTHNSLNPVAWRSELELYSLPLIKAGEIFLIFSIFFHGLNGLRLLLVEYFNIFLPKTIPSSLYLEKILSLHNPQKTMLYIVLILSIILTILGALYLYNILTLRW
ncbi:MAG: hypothetical protein ACP5I7_01145 [Sulfolobales archaeon]